MPNSIFKTPTNSKGNGNFVLSFLQTVVQVKESLDTPAIPAPSAPPAPVKSEKERQKDEAQRRLEMKKREEADQNAGRYLFLASA